MDKLGKHTTMDPETSRSVGWLDQRAEIDKITLSTFRPLKHRRPVGHVEIRETVGSGFRCTVYSGVGLRDIHVHTKTPALVKQLIENHWRRPVGGVKKKFAGAAMEQAMQGVLADVATRGNGDNGHAAEYKFTKVTDEAEPMSALPFDKQGPRVSTQLTMEIIEFSPELALEYLKHNTNNRDLQESRVRDYAVEMLTGRWIPEASSIEIDDSGQLANGQHQLYAVVEAGMTNPNIRVRMRVTFGMPVAARTVIDTNRSRTSWDVAVLMRPELRGGGFSRVHVAVLSWLGGRGWRRTGQRFQYHDMEPLLNKYGEAVQFALSTRGRHRTRKGMTAAVFAVIARAWFTQDRVKLARFVEILYSGLVDRPDENAAIKLREFMERSDNSQLGQVELYQKTQRALTQFLAGVYVDRLVGMTQDVFPIPPVDDDVVVQN